MNNTGVWSDIIKENIPEIKFLYRQQTKFFPKSLNIPIFRFSAPTFLNSIQTSGNA
ncbi:hypothetical protein IV38_GL001849 [Lactobacillus selangorensis]|uniref:Uncharacterized protein n=1 Tax=Lactobacillus selangorensis TaxID=81857 RepID=A0A0R2FHE5_9LACO|nr:hypothetical protein IV38_GL001849 [Lactobacillus selangorensis]KRN30521.1 hypothetical protein IV40_GL001706 [Lactobacillus selangorensis]